MQFTLYHGISCTRGDGLLVVETIYYYSNIKSYIILLSYKMGACCTNTTTVQQLPRRRAISYRGRVMGLFAAREVNGSIQYNILLYINIIQCQNANSIIIAAKSRLVMCGTRHRVYTAIRQSGSPSFYRLRITHHLFKFLFLEFINVPLKTIFQNIQMFYAKFKQYSVKQSDIPTHIIGMGRQLKISRQTNLPKYFQHKHITQNIITNSHYLLQI